MKCAECKIEMISSNGCLVCPACGLVDNDSLVFSQTKFLEKEFELKKKVHLEPRIEKRMDLYARSDKEKTEAYRINVLQDTLNELEYYPADGTRKLIYSEYRNLNKKEINNLTENAVFAIALVALRNNLNLITKIKKRFGIKLANKTRYFLSKFENSNQKLLRYIADYSENETISNLAREIAPKLKFVSFIKHRAIIAIFIAMKMLHEKNFRERIAKRANLYINRISCLKVKFRKQIDLILNELKVGG